MHARDARFPARASLGNLAGFGVRGAAETIAGQDHGVSDTDTFIDEVTEEVRRDKLFAAMRRYGWIAILAVLVLVGAASYSEWRKARDNSAAQALGDAVLGSIQGEGPVEGRIAMLTDQPAEGDAAALVALIAAAQEADAGARDAAIARLDEMLAGGGIESRYADLARLKVVLLTADTTAPDDRIAALSGLTAPGAPYRVLAEEQIALAELEKGDTDVALERLQRLTADSEATDALRTRVSQLIVALGADPTAE